MRPNSPSGSVQCARFHTVVAGIVATLCLSLVSAPGMAAAHRPWTTARMGSPGDSVYNAYHPRLLFTPAELPALQVKVRDGGRDDEAYATIREIVASVYPTKTEAELLQDSYGINIMPNLGLAAYLETPLDRAAVDFGRHMTLYMVDTYEPDDQVFYSSLRLKVIATGYDMFFSDAPDSIRARVRDEIISYVETAMTVFNYERWLHSPYVSNYNTVIGSALGIAALCLEHEMPAEWVRDAVRKADEFIEAWRRVHIDPDGAYSEGPMYAGWSMRNLAYYWWARSRLYDHHDLSALEGIRSLETWLALSLLPIGDAALNNVNDSAVLNYPFSRHHTYLDWAQAAWGSGVSAWLWERLVGPEYGHDSGMLADQAATVLWHANIPPENPRNYIPRRMLFRRCGQYYFRTGWPEGDASDDVVFSFYSGKFMGGHAQEDQNNFTLWGYGTGFAMDNGFGAPAKESEGHNLILIDGKGQHNAGGSIGTDGAIREHLLSGFADYMFGDATSAYTTYSEFNRPDWPFPGEDWSWGYDGGNPVEFAYRRIIVVHDASAPPYFVIADEIRKDASPHVYSWRFHSHEDNAIDPSDNPLRISGGRGFMDLFVVNPPFNSLDVALEPFDNQNEDPNTTVISLSYQGTAFSLCALLLPGSEPTQHAVTGHAVFPWGAAAVVSWPGSVLDIVIVNPTGEEVAFVPEAMRKNAIVGTHVGSLETTERLEGSSIATDTRLAVLRVRGSEILGLMATEVSRLDWGGVPYARVEDAKLNLAFSADTVYIDRADADFSFYLPRGGEVRCDGAVVPALNDRAYAIPDRSGAPLEFGTLRLRAFPNPFNATANVVVDLDVGSEVDVSIYDVQGRLVRHLWNGALLRGGNLLRWDGKRASGDPAASGIYLIRAEIANVSTTVKIVHLK